MYNIIVRMIEQLSNHRPSPVLAGVDRAGGPPRARSPSRVGVVAWARHGPRNVECIEWNGVKNEMATGGLIASPAICKHDPRRAPLPSRRRGGAWRARGCVTHSYPSLPSRQRRELMRRTTRRLLFLVAAGPTQVAGQGSWIQLAGLPMPLRLPPHSQLPS